MSQQGRTVNITVRDKLTPALYRAAHAAQYAAMAFREFAWRFRVRRCASCYLPMRHAHFTKTFVCDLCGTTITDQAIANRSKWRRRLDWGHGDGLLKRVLAPEGVTVATDPAKRPGTFTITVRHRDVIYASEPLNFNASLKEIRWATRHLPITISVPQTWWSDLIGYALTLVIIAKMIWRRQS